MRNFLVNEGNTIASQEPQAFGMEQSKVTASAKIIKGQCVAITGDWKVAPTSDTNSAKYVGIAFLDAEIDEPVSIVTEGFVKLDGSGTITAGDEVVPTADGKVKKATDKGIGIAIAGGTDAVVYVKLR